MRRFRFNLESVLTIRAHNLEEEKIKLSKVVQVYLKEKQKLENLVLKLNDLRNNSSSYFEQTGFSGVLMGNYMQYVSKMENVALTQKNIIKKIEFELNVQQEKTKKAYIQLKTLENLKQKRKEEYNRQVLLEEIKILDDITNSKRTA